ncbi:MAG: AtpZ/AtpI family protein [Patescibacteria group bacterium]
MGDFGATIAVPVVLFVLIGKWLDGKYGTEPWVTILGFVLAAALSAWTIWKKAKRYGREYEEIDKKHESNSN